MTKATPLLPLWRDPNNWPLEPIGWLFWARALDLLGAAVDEAWEGGEFGVEPAPVVPPYKSPLSAQAAYVASQMLAAHDPSFPRPPTGRLADTVSERLRLIGSITTPSYNVSQRRPLADKSALGATLATARGEVPAGTERAAYSRAQKIALTVAAERLPMHLRAQAAERAISSALLNGALEAAYHFKEDGRVYPVLASWWNTDPATRWARYTSCKIDWRNPTAQPRLRGASDPSWLYVSEASVDAFVRAARIARRAEWWPVAADAGVKGWLRRPEVVAEALRRLPSGGARDAYLQVLFAMWTESDAVAVQPDTIRRHLAAHPELWPPHVAQK